MRCLSPPGSRSPASASAQTYAPKTTAAPASLTKDGYAQAKKEADAQYKIDREACSSLSGNAKDICIAEAKAKNDIARAEAAVAYENTPKTRENARVAHARAAYDVEHREMRRPRGQPQGRLREGSQGRARQGQGRREVDRVAVDTRQDATTKQADAVKEANAEKREADYKVAIEKCDAFAGPAKDACVGNAKVQYGKS